MLKIKPYPFLLMILLGWTLSLLPKLALAQITATLDRNPVNLDESFRITFTATDAPDDEPDFTPLEQDFTILNQSQSDNSSWINGQVSRNIQWTLNVMAKNAGTLIVPAIHFGNSASRAITVKVIDTPDNNDPAAGDDLFLDASVDTDKPYLQAQVIYTLRLYTRVDIAQARLSEPELDDAVIEKLGNDNSFNTQIDGVGYSVTERKYAIFPQKSGRYTLAPLVLTAEVLNQGGRPLFDGFFNSPMARTRSIKSKAITLQVQPAPAAFTAPHWLPAEHMQLTQAWSGDVNAMTAGEPLTRTIKLQAKGATVGQLPELGVTAISEPLRAYPDQPVLQEQKNADGLSGYREEKIALLASKPGRYTLPEISVPWFDTRRQKMTIARIPETVITVMAAPGAPATAPQPAPAPTQSTPIAQPARLSQPTTGYWPWLALTFALAWLATLGYFWAKRPRSTEKSPADRSDEPPQPNLNDAINRLKKACAANDANAAKQALLDWGQIQGLPPGLAAIAEHCEARLRDEMLLLNQTLYSKETGPWNGKRLLQVFSEHQARAKLTGIDDGGLRPLHRL